MTIIRGKRIGWAITGSHCTIATYYPQIQKIIEAGATVHPFLSPAVLETDTRFGSAAACREKIKSLTGKEAVTTVVEAEPVGPENLIDLLVIAPCTGNTMAKLAQGITDNAVLMAAKAHLRNGGPVLVALSTNDALGLNASNLAVLLCARNIYLVPFGQDNPQQKPYSLVAQPELLLPALRAALRGDQFQPLLVMQECGDRVWKNENQL